MNGRLMSDPSGVIPYPGRTSDMADKPRDEMREYVGRNLPRGKRALITGGDSGIGRAVAVAFAKEGADVAIAYLEENAAAHTSALVEEAGRRCTRLPGDLAEAQQCRSIVERTAETFGGLDILVNNVASQNPPERFTDITDDQWRRTFAVNIDSFFGVTKAALEHLPNGAAMINTGSINGLRGMSLTYSLAQSLADRRIRVNSVAPVWTPLIPATMDAERVESFGGHTPFGRAAQPDEIAPSYVFFAAAQLSSYYSGEVLAPIGGETLPG